MKKLTLILLGMLINSYALADYYKCEIEQSGVVLASFEAPYRYVRASVEYDEFLCKGHIDSAGFSRVMIKNLKTGEMNEAIELGSKASTSLSTLPRHNEFDISCTCGMN